MGYQLTNHQHLKELNITSDANLTMLLDLLRQEGLKQGLMDTCTDWTFRWSYKGLKTVLKHGFGSKSLRGQGHCPSSNLKAAAYESLERSYHVTAAH